MFTALKMSVLVLGCCWVIIMCGKHEGAEGEGLKKEAVCSSATLAQYNPNYPT
jgi:hypothetical protein